MNSKAEDEDEEEEIELEDTSMDDNFPQVPDDLGNAHHLLLVIILKGNIYKTPRR